MTRRQDDITNQRAHMPPGTGGILDARSLAASHRRLNDLLRPGLRVLDVGCGTGAITRGVAAAVGPGGLAVGSDINAALLADGSRQQGSPSLRFVGADVYALPFAPTFDIVAAARVLQWLAHPLDAIRAMCSAARPGATILVLDYNHEQIAWSPPPPASMQSFYAAFLAWRAGAGMENAIAERLPALFQSARLTNVIVTPAPERTTRGEADFEQRAGIWASVAAIRGHQIVADGFLTERDRAAAEDEYRRWLREDAESMTLHLETVEGTVSN